MDWKGRMQGIEARMQLMEAGVYQRLKAVEEAMRKADESWKGMERRMGNIEGGCIRRKTNKMN